MIGKALLPIELERLTQQGLRVVKVGRLGPLLPRLPDSHAVPPYSRSCWEVQGDAR